MANWDKNRQQQQAAKPAEPAVKVPEPAKAEAPVTVAEAEIEETVAVASPETPSPTAAVSVAEVVTVNLPEAAEEKMVTVVPRETVPSTYIGGRCYSFLKGTATKVPASVRALLQEKGLL